MVINISGNTYKYWQEDTHKQIQHTHTAQAEYMCSNKTDKKNMLEFFQDNAQEWETGSRRTACAHIREQHLSNKQKLMLLP